MASTSPIVNFPFLSSNIPSVPAYGVNVSQLIRYARAAQSIRTLSSEANCLLKDFCCPRDFKKRNWCQHIKRSRGDATILSVPTTWLFPELLFMLLLQTSHKQTFKIPGIFFSRHFPISLVRGYGHDGGGAEGWGAGRNMFTT